MTSAIEKKQARGLAYSILPHIADYIKANPDKYEAWLKTQTDSDCIDELAKIETAKKSAAAKFTVNGNQMEDKI